MRIGHGQLGKGQKLNAAMVQNMKVGVWQEMRLEG